MDVKEVGMGAWAWLRSIDDRIFERNWRKRAPEGPNGPYARQLWARLGEEPRDAVRRMAVMQEVVEEPEVALLLQDLGDQVLARMWRNLVLSLLVVLGLVAVGTVVALFVFESSLSGLGGALGGIIGTTGGLIGVTWRYDRARRENAAVAREAGLLG